MGNVCRPDFPNRFGFTAIFAVACIAIIASPNWVSAQTTAGSAGSSQTTPPLAPTIRQPRPVSLAHLYWHFLQYQDHLDTRAAAMVAQGHDAGNMRGYLQQRLNLTDSDYVAIRASKKRLVSEIQALDAQARQIVAGGPTPTTRSQLAALTVQREADINAEKWLSS
jgi:hypothetical protein